MVPLAAAAYSGMAEAVRLCLAAAPGGAAAAAKWQDYEGWTALYFAAHGGHAEAMVVLLDAGADPNQAEEEEAAGMAPLHVATNDMYLEAARLLLERGAAVDATTKKGSTPLMLACKHGHVEAARLLLEKGAAVDAKNEEGMTPLMVACQKGQVEAARLLLENGAAVDAKDEDGRTALMVACMKGHVIMTRLLLEKGADRTLADNDGDTAASYYLPRAPTEEAKAQLRALLA